MKYNAVLDVSFASLGDLPLTRSEAKVWLKIEDDNTDEDELIDDLIPAAVEVLESWCNQSIRQKTVTATILNQLGGQYLPYGPIREVTSVTDEDGGDIDSTDYTFKGASFQYLKTEFCDPVTVVYNAGYSVLPYKFKQAVKEQLAWMYTNRGDETAENDISKQARNTLQSERRV